MCFSPEADLVAGVVPAVLAAHSLIESVIWLGGRGAVGSTAGTVATYVYLLIAFTVLPILVPFAVRAREVRADRRRALSVLLLAGLTVSIVLSWSILDGPVTVTLHPHFIQYRTDIPWPGPVVAATVLAIVNVAGLTSLWCGWAVDRIVMCTALQ